MRLHSSQIGVFPSIDEGRYSNWLSEGVYSISRVFGKSQIPLLKVLYSTLKNASWGRWFGEKNDHFGKYLRWVDQIPKFFYQSFLGCMAKDDKKKFGPGPGQACWAWVQSSQGRAQFVENLKMTIFMYVMSKNLNCLRVICLPYGCKKFFWPNWPTLGTPGHPQAPLEVA